MLKLLINNHRSSEPPRIAVIVKEHTRRYTSHLEKIFPNVVVFYTNDLSHDDIFLLYAAMHSGPFTYFITRDKMRNHRFLMGKESKLMARWQRTRQILHFDRQRQITLNVSTSFKFPSFPTIIPLQNKNYFPVSTLTSPSSVRRRKISTHTI